MIRRSGGAVAAALAALGVLVALPALALASSPAVAATTLPPAAHSAAISPVSSVAVGVDDFTFASFDAVYELGRDAARRSTLATTETLVAQFPEIDQNHGIRRAIPLDYQGHPTDIRIESVTDAAGTPRAYETEADDDGEFLLVTIADDAYVHGEQTYVIRYTQHNVTLEPDDATIDEFYWDVNGTGWAQPFGRVSAELRMSPDVAEGFTGDTACYRGGSGSTATCDSLAVTDATPPAVLATAVALGPYENLTLAAGFDPATFEPRDESFAASPPAIAGAVAAGLALAALVAAIVLYALRWRDHPGRGTIIAQYEPPEGVSAMVAADVVGRAQKGVTATILERAVAGELRVVETGRKQYAVEFVGGAWGDTDAISVVSALYSDAPFPGARRELKARDTTLGRRLLALRQGVAKRVVQEGIRRRPDPVLRLLLAVAAIGAATLSVVFGVIALDDHRGGAWPFLLFAGAIAAAIAAVIVVAGVRPLTERGREIRDHLEGLRLYIRLAEADRLRVLQSPSGALRVDRPAAASVAGIPTATPTATDAPPAAATLDPAVVLKLNERLLPYAVLFGLEQEWSRELAALYEERGESPGWYSGRGAFDSRAFAVGVASFSSASSTSWSGSSSSSSSSGSGGGGSSGGGGGGGGGGGV